MEKNENGVCLPDIDLADFNHLVSLDDRGAAAFDGFMRNLAEKLTTSLPDEENPLKNTGSAFICRIVRIRARQGSAAVNTGRIRPIFRAGILSLCSTGKTGRNRERGRAGFYPRTRVVASFLAARE